MAQEESLDVSFGPEANGIADGMHRVLVASDKVTLGVGVGEEITDVLLLPCSQEERLLLHLR